MGLRVLVWVLIAAATVAVDASAQSYAPGQDIEVERYGEWVPARVVRQDASGVLVRLPLPDGRYDPATSFEQTLPLSKVRLRAPKPAPEPQPRGGGFAPGQEVVVQYMGEPRKGQVVRHDQSGVLVRFPLADGRYDPATSFERTFPPNLVSAAGAGSDKPGPTPDRPQPGPGSGSGPQPQGSGFVPGQDVVVQYMGEPRKGQVVRHDQSGVLVRFPLADGRYDPATSFERTFPPELVSAAGAGSRQGRPTPDRPQPQPRPEVQPGNPADGQGQGSQLAGEGLLSKEDVLAYMRKVFGAQPWEDRDRKVAQIRDYIAARCTNFKTDIPWESGPFQEAAGRGYCPTIIQTINANYGPHPVVSDYYGPWLMRSGARGAFTSEKPKGDNWVERTTTDASAYNSETLIIVPDGTWVWKESPRDPPTAWLRGKWRVLARHEQDPKEGGPVLWLGKARMGNDYSVRMNREQGYSGWIDVGTGANRQSAIEWGEHPQD